MNMSHPEMELEAISRLLDERAIRLAQRSQVQSTRREAAHVICTSRAGRLWGFPIVSVREIRLVQITLLPLGTPAIPALFPVRGQVYCLADIAALEGDCEMPRHGERVFAVIVTGKRGTLGFRMDELFGPRIVHEDELSTLSGVRRQSFTKSVTRDLLQLVDVDALLEQPALTTLG